MSVKIDPEGPRRSKKDPVRLRNLRQTSQAAFAASSFASWFTYRNDTRELCTSTYILFLSYSNDKFYILKQNLHLWAYLHSFKPHSLQQILCLKTENTSLKSFLANLQFVQLGCSAVPACSECIYCRAAA